ncbi:hypothetical protein JTB14_030176 [Gonioctena quinquepunctata]|nr:hypothetical protein JTB14_030176 [Gonioctena quinquepunctata]
MCEEPNSQDNDSSGSSSEESEESSEVLEENRKEKILYVKPKEPEKTSNKQEMQKKFEENHMEKVSDQLLEEVNQTKTLLTVFICLLFLWVMARTLLNMRKMFLILKNANKFSWKYFVIGFFFPKTLKIHYLMEKPNGIVSRKPAPLPSVKYDYI